MIQSDGTEMCCSCYSKWKETLPEENAALRTRIVELEHQLENHKASADGTTHWCAECKMRDDHIAELERSAVVWHKYPDEKPERPMCKTLPRPVDWKIMLIAERTHDNSMVYVKHATYYWDRDGTGFFEYQVSEGTTTHWAYLPEPPREEG